MAAAFNSTSSENPLPVAIGRPRGFLDTTLPHGRRVAVLTYIARLEGQGWQLLWATMGPRAIDLTWLPAGADDPLAAFTTTLCFSGALEDDDPLAGVAGTA